MADAASTESKFRNHQTLVRINPETYIKFDGSDRVMISNIYSQDAISLKSDILLLLWDLVDWKSVGELIAPWPPDDQEKIMDHLDKLYQAKIVISEESELREAPESGLSDKVGSRVHFNVENHHNMLKDYVRLAAYRRAIERTVKPGMVAMDLGCGTGVLGFFASIAGADKVYAIERRPDVLELAQGIAQQNNIQNMDFIEGASSAIKEERINPKPDVFISEILGNGILEENIVEFTVDARDRFLKPGGKMIPWKLDIYVFAFQSDIKKETTFEVREFTDLYGIDFSLLGQVLEQKAVLRLDRYNHMLNITMSEPTLVKSIDFLTLENTVFSQDFTLTMLKDGHMSGYCAYFKAWLDEETTLTNSPWAPQTHWTQMIYILPDARFVKAGEEVKMDLVYDGLLRIRPCW